MSAAQTAVAIIVTIFIILIIIYALQSRGLKWKIPLIQQQQNMMRGYNESNGYNENNGCGCY